MVLKPPAHQSLAAAVAAQIRAAIDQEELLPGDRLVERRLAEELGVSHIPVREALGRLEDEGVVTRAPRRGARVADLTDRELDEIASLRIALEELAVELVMRRWSPKFERALEGDVDAMSASARAGDAATLLDLDRRFHETIWELADHALLMEIANQISLRVSRFLRAATMALTRVELVDQAQEHHRILQALASSDIPAAQREMREHIERAHRRIERVRQRTARESVQR